MKEDKTITPESLGDFINQMIESECEIKEPEVWVSSGHFKRLKEKGLIENIKTTDLNGGTLSQARLRRSK
ncbi:MAG: hypothetical protein GY787_23995 [Alteromonadales bacterium]|nr:hypothetical protein [Alteromonadales bacterium]